MKWNQGSGFPLFPFHESLSTKLKRKLKKPKVSQKIKFLKTKKGEFINYKILGFEKRYEEAQKYLETKNI